MAVLVHLFDDSPLVSGSRPRRMSGDLTASLPSQEHTFQIVMKDSEEARTLGLHRKWKAACVLKVNRDYVTLYSEVQTLVLFPLIYELQASFDPVFEWPLNLVKHAGHEGRDAFITAFLPQYRTAKQLSFTSAEVRS